MDDLNARLNGLLSMGGHYRYEAIAQAINSVAAADTEDADLEMKLEGIEARKFLEKVKWREQWRRLYQQISVGAVVGVSFLFFPDGLELLPAVFWGGLFVWTAYDMYYRRRPREDRDEFISEEDLRQGREALQRETVPLYELADRLRGEFCASGNVHARSISKERKDQWLRDLRNLQQLAIDVWVGVEPARKAWEEYELWQDHSARSDQSASPPHPTLAAVCRYLEAVQDQAKQFIDHGYSGGSTS